MFPSEAYNFNRHLRYSALKMWKKLKFSQRYEKSEDACEKSVVPWYERHEKSKDGTKSPQMVRNVYGIRKVWHSLQLLIDY